MSDIHPERFGAYARRCWMVFAAIVCGTLLTVAASYAPVSNRGVAVGLVLAGACVNAFIVAGYLMHLLSERRTVYALLVFTIIFVVGLLGLTVWSWYQVPVNLRH